MAVAHFNTDIDEKIQVTFADNEQPSEEALTKAQEQFKKVWPAVASKAREYSEDMKNSPLTKDDKKIQGLLRSLGREAITKKPVSTDLVTNTVPKHK
jgi:hypothetical protein